MKVGYVLKRYPRLSQTFIINEIAALEAQGLAVDIFSLRFPREEDRLTETAAVKASVTYLPGPGATWLPTAHGADPREAYQADVLARLLTTRGVSHLHAHFGNSATTVAMLASRLTGVPYSFTAHARDIFHEAVIPIQLRTKLKESIAVVTVSDYNAHYLRQTYGTAAKAVHRVYNGLDLDRFRFTMPGNRPMHIVAVGRLVEKKGFADLIDACAFLRQRGTRFRCSIVGAGPLESALRAQIARLALSDCVEMLGAKSHEEVLAIMREAAACALPCVVGEDGDRDGLPTVLLEAMALGTPCVSTDVTGIPEILRNEETGLVVCQGHPPALADALDRLLHDLDLRLRLAAGARMLIESEFDVRRNAARLRDLFATSHLPARPIQ